VAGYVSGQFRRRAGDPQDIALEAWSRVFLDYWSGNAHKRVLGTSAISSLVCGTAYFIGCDALRRQKVEAVMDEQQPSPVYPRLSAAGMEPPAHGADEEMATKELEHHVKACRAELPARQQLAARMVWDHTMRQVDVARKLGVSAPAVSQLLEKARAAMYKCLKSKGLVATHGPGSPGRRSPRRRT
jgi:DNA-directed RNA polymerase specialized sigma24 family protein